VKKQQKKEEEEEVPKVEKMDFGFHDIA